MWVAAAMLGTGVLLGVILALGLVARALPEGRGRELVGFLPNCVVLLRRLRRDEALSRRARVVVGLALAYLVSPVQVVPNFVPVIGYSDDVVVFTLALRYAARSVPPEVLQAAWPGDPARLERLLRPRRR